jgi:hypothetical protein
VAESELTEPRGESCEHGCHLVTDLCTSYNRLLSYNYFVAPSGNYCQMAYIFTLLKPTYIRSKLLNIVFQINTYSLCTENNLPHILSSHITHAAKNTAVKYYEFSKLPVLKIEDEYART